MEVLESSLDSMGRFRPAAAFFFLAAAFCASGCGTPGAPQPPSLNLPDRIEDLKAARNGNEVSLTWTMSKKTTDKLLLKDKIPVQVCRKLADGGCDQTGRNIALAPGADGTFSETLPPTLVAGTPRPLSYFIELRSQNNRSAGPSNPAMVLAGEAPPPVASLTAEVRKDGIALRWAPGPEASQANHIEIRLHRKLIIRQAEKPKNGLLSPQPQPVTLNLLVETTSNRALDKQVEFGQTYEYRAQRVTRIAFGGQTVELSGELSAPVRLEALDKFPPAVPNDLAAVAATNQSGTEAAIDLSWQPAADLDLAGYAVYRREGDAGWERISPSPPLVAPAFHDTQVQPGHTYRYAVSSIDQGGHESARSPETQETVPSP